MFRYNPPEKIKQMFNNLRDHISVCRVPIDKNKNTVYETQLNYLACVCIM